MKKLVSAGIFVALLVLLITSVHAADAFSDVPDGQYYSDAVVWAVGNGVTQGIGSGRFGPDETCTRAQVVTFLWRANGAPQPTSGQCAFTDIDQGAYYYSAVLWAVEHGITTGVDRTHFAPDLSCTRAQVVTFLWRAMGSPEGSGADPSFYDVPTGQWYTQAVTWAVAESVTNGVGGGKFGADDVCSRAQIVTFLWRAEGSEVPADSFKDGEAVVEKSHDILYRMGVYEYDFTFEILNDSGHELTIRKIELVHYRDGIEDPNHLVLSDEVVQNIYMSHVTPPGEMFSYCDMHGAIDGNGNYIADVQFDCRKYIFSFTDEVGGEYQLIYICNLSKQLAEGQGQEEDNGEGPVTPPNYSDDGKDLEKLRHGADFSVEVTDGLFWVPAVSLGESDYTNGEIRNMLTQTPEEKQQNIDTLYEAIQLFQIGQFSFTTDEHDNVRIYENGIEWEHHKPGYHGVRTNNGCCAACANWLNYILKDDYDEVGYVAFSLPDGSGHIYNYIKEDGWYYFVDLTKLYYDLEVQFGVAYETGGWTEYYNSDYSGNIHKTRSIDVYVDYLMATYLAPPGMMFMYTADDCVAVCPIGRADGVVVFYEDNEDVEVHTIYDDPNDSLTVEFIPGPELEYDYWKGESFDFDALR